MSLLRQGKAQILTIYVGESDTWKGKTLYVEIIQFLRDHGCAGATAMRAIAGYGAGMHLHEQKLWKLTSDAPIIIQVVDQPERLQRVLPQLCIMVNEGLITLHETSILKYTHARTHALPTNLPVKDVMGTSIITVLSTTPISDVVNLLLDAPFRALPVVDEQHHLLGIIGTGDLIKASVLPLRRGIVRTARELSLFDDQSETMLIGDPLAQLRYSQLRADAVMNTQLHTVPPDLPIREAARIMLEQKVRRLPVVNQDRKLLGMLSRMDLLQVILASPLLGASSETADNPTSVLNELPTSTHQPQLARDYMQRGIATISEQASITEIIDNLLLSPLKRVIVVDQEQHILGIISDVDVLTQMQAEARPNLLQIFTNWARGKPARVPTGTLHSVTGNGRTAADIMNLQVVTISETTSVQETIEKMISSGHTILPVVNQQQQLRGVVGRSDLLKVLLKE